MPQEPRASLLPGPVSRCKRLTRLTMSPTVTGPMRVQRNIAHVTVTKTSELLLVCGLLLVVRHMPLLSASDEMRKPISPRATIAHPSIDAGYRDTGLFVCCVC